MDCLKNQIGLKNCGIEPKTDYYVNDLPGISTELTHRVADSDQLNFTGLWESVQTRAQRKFGQLVQRFINRNKNWNEILYQTPGFKIVTPLAYQTVSNAEAVINLPDGKYVEANVKSILVYSGTEVLNAALAITDSFGNILKAIASVDLKLGLNRVPVNYAVGSEDAGGQFSVTLSTITEITEATATAVSDTEIALNWTYLENGLSLSPIDLNYSAALHSCSTTNGTIQEGGLIIPEIDIKCSVGRYICENVNLFTYALWYLHGAELLAEKLTSPRTTYFSTSNLEYTKRLQADFYTEFEESTLQSLKAINWQGLCVECKEDNPGQISYGALIA